MREPVHRPSYTKTIAHIAVDNNILSTVELVAYIWNKPADKVCKDIEALRLKTRIAFDKKRLKELR